MGILEILAQLLQFIREVLFPFWIVQQPNRAVRYTFGIPGIPWRWWRGNRDPVLEPGWYFGIPWVHDIVMTNCAEDTIDIANLSITTEDGIQGTVSYNLRLKVIDPLKYQINLRQELDPKKSDSIPSAIHAEASTVVAKMLRKQSWELIYKSQGEIAGKITSALKTKLADWGVSVTSGGITIMAQARPIALIHVD